jgi:AraC family transcriptional regulator
MKHVGRGRIVVWEGASLWAFDVPRLPERQHRTEIHAHHAIQLTISAGGSFGFRIGTDVVEGPVVLIAPDVPHAYDAVGRNAMIFIEPESRIGTAAMRQLADRPVARLAPETFTDLAERMSCIWQPPRPDDATLVKLGKELALRLAADDLAARTTDVRIARVLEVLSVDTERRLSVQRAADIACLSESRFSHLFVAEVGLPFRTYMLWQRLMRAVEGISAGTSLTAAAHNAGFADSAHFSRTFHRMFGLPASLLQMI